MGTVIASDKVTESVAYINTKVKAKAEIAIVLGTGMYSIVEEISEKVVIDYRDIPHFPTSTVPSHKGQLVFGKLNGKNVIVVSGRFHYYEGYSMESITYYIHVLAALGVTKSILTSASGGLNPHYRAGDLVIIEDHINLFSEHPLRGANDESMGPRFPDMLHAYSKDYISIATHEAQLQNIRLHKGVYLGWQGPSLETPAEYKMARMMGADLVGMSTIPEVIVNKYRGIDTLAFTIVSNICFPKSILTETTVEEVISTVHANAIPLIRLIKQIVSRL